MYIGSEIQTQGISLTVIQQFIAEVQHNGIGNNLAAQLCAQSGRNAKYAMGIFANTDADLVSVQDAVQSWKSGKCITGYDDVNSHWYNITFQAPSVTTNVTSNSTLAARKALRSLHRRDTCSAIQIAFGDTCTTLPAECGIAPAQFTEYNPTLCSKTLAVGQYVCCSEGSLPDYAPQPYSNGTCATYTIITGDTCAVLAAEYTITVDQIESWNNETWGWMGCADLQAGTNICLSSGNPPMPAVVPNAVCGPQVPGTPVVAYGIDLSSLNGCPLNACCDIWGQCGTTTEFCTPSNSSTGNPGTAAPEENGCISNCGTQIVQSEPPAEFIKIGYFEGFDMSRPCLQASISDINPDVSGYTHIYLAFATLSADFSVNISSIADQFMPFVSLTGVKRIISFGGWEFSTSADTYAIFREAVQEANRATFVNNIIDFLNTYDLDGVDLDWEYPGEPDIPGIPSSSSTDTTDFFLFMNGLRTSMNKNAPGKILSTTAPASFWYLQNIPIEAIALTTDIVVLMTYDLHGQWDYSSAFSDPSCPDGNCLRSDVNLTETLNALSMITKAGVPSNKIAVGVTSYGRSFQMTEAGCYTEMCTYTGPGSGATPGPCTQTAGYLANGEINQIIAENSTGLIQYLDDSYSNIVVYDETQWISYMDDSNKDVRSQLYQALAFGGTADWAIDLQGDDVTSSVPGDGDSGLEIYVPPDIWSNPSPIMSCAPPCTFVQPPIPLPTPQTVNWEPYVTSFLHSNQSGSTTTTTSTFIVPPFVIGALPVWPVTIAQGDPVNGTWIPEPRVFPPPLTVDLPPYQAVISPTPNTGGGLPSVTSTSVISTGTGSSTTAVPVFFPTPQVIHLQPQPTIPIVISFPMITPTVTYSSASNAGPTTTAGCPGCGEEDCDLFGCFPGCGIFACEGGCGIFGCYGGCGLLGCHGNCPLSECGGDGDGDGQTTTACATSTTVTDCMIGCVASPNTASGYVVTSCYTTSCSQTVGCAATATTTTSITTSGCPVLPVYTPWYTDVNQLLPTPGDPNWGGVIYAVGTYSPLLTLATASTTSITPSTTSTSTTASTSAAPTPCVGITGTLSTSFYTQFEITVEENGDQTCSFTCNGIIDDCTGDCISGYSAEADSGYGYQDNPITIVYNTTYGDFTLEVPIAYVTCDNCCGGEIPCSCCEVNYSGTFFGC
jgi:chitinase